MSPSTPNPAAMHEAHRFGFQPVTGQWRLCGRGVVGLPATDHDRQLCLRSGRLWLTGPDGDGLMVDRWLEAGDCTTLPAGSDWLAGAEPQAAWVLLEAPAVQPRAAGLRLAVAAALALGGAALVAFAAWARSAAAIASRTQGAISAGDSRASAGTVQ